MTNAFIDHYLREISDDIAAQKEQLIQESVMEYTRFHASQGVRIRIERPSWMPERIFRFLLRAVIVEQTPAQTKVIS